MLPAVTTTSNRKAVTDAPCRANIVYGYPTAATRSSDTELMTLLASTPMFNMKENHIIHQEAVAAADTVDLEDMGVAPVHIFHPDTRNRNPYAL
jgi:hypothetical protein